MACSNCFNGCAEIVSDQCVKYTGVDIPLLGIQNGDSLSYVEQTLIGFLTSTLDATGIKPTIDPLIICNVVQKYLPDCGDLTALDLFNALIKAACDLQEQIDVIVAQLEALEGTYDVDCLTGVTSSSGTHAILQAVITQLCTLSADFAAFVLDVETNYVKKSELCALVAACTPTPDVTQYKDRMVPYAVVEYYGSLGNFDVTGAGLSANGFEDIYLCNGNNGTPDKRGRIPVGAIQGVPGGALNPVVDPFVSPGNPNYALSGTAGANTVTLSSTQIPAHTHSATVTLTDPGHTHTLAYKHGQADQDEPGVSGDLMDMDGVKSSSATTNSSTTGITVVTTIGSTGGGQSHNNIPPVLAAYYIMYIP